MTDKHRSNRPTLDEIERVLGDPLAVAIVRERLGESAVREVGWDEIADGIRGLYVSRAPATLAKHLQVVGLLAGSGIAVGGLDQAAVARLVAEWSVSRAPATVNSLLRVLRTQCNWFVDAGFLLRSPFGGRRQFWLRERKRKAKHFSVAEVLRLLDRAELESFQNDLFDTRWGWKARRRRALLVLVLYTGLRAREALRLRRVDFDWSAQVVDVCEDAGRLKTCSSADIVPLADAVVGVVRPWVAELRGDFAFPCITCDRPWLTGGPGYRPVDDLKAFGRRAGVEGVTLLRLRHTWSTHAESLFGLTAPQIQRILRHTTVGTQKCYRHADAANLVGLVKHHDFRMVG